MRRCVLLGWAALAAASCGGAGGVSARFDPTLAPTSGEAAESWLAFPCPSDHRRTAAGKIRLSAFPNPGEVGLAQSYVAAGEANLDGFSTNGAVYVAFDGELDTATLPEGLSADGPLQLIDVTPALPRRGRAGPCAGSTRERRAGTSRSARWRWRRPPASLSWRRRPTRCSSTTGCRGRTGGRCASRRS
jgi:hypothetical protein